jgi:restriction endonuclease S subunit
MDLDRWGGDSLKNKEKLSFLKNGKYKVTELKNIIKFIQYGLSEKANSSNIGIPMLRMNNINNAELSIDNLKYINLSNQIIEKTKLNKNDLLFNRTNSKELVGKTAVFDKDGVYTFASYLIRIKLDESKCDVHYLNYFLNSRIGRIQIDLTSRQITGQANINSKELQGFIVPLPSLSIQKQIASNVESIRKQVKSLRSEAEKLRVGAKEAFTRELFS